MNVEIKVEYHNIEEGATRDDLEIWGRRAAEDVVRWAGRLYHPEYVHVDVNVCGAEVAGQSYGYWLAVWYNDVCVAVAWSAVRCRELAPADFERCATTLIVVDMYHHYRVEGGDAQ